MRNLLLIVTLTVLTSCGDSLVESRTRSTEVAAGIVSRPLGRMAFDGADVYRGDSETARKARIDLLSGVMDRFGRIRAAVRSDANWGEKLGQVRLELGAAEVSEGESWFLDQMSASLMLESMGLSPGSREADVTAEWNPGVAGECVEMLLRRSSPNALLIAGALERLDGHWSAARLRTSAEKAKRDAMRWLEIDCADCRERAPGNPDQARWTKGVREVRRGVAELRRLSAVG